jgi:CPA1 family monovalent cation:H+ antiporter
MLWGQQQLFFSVSISVVIAYSAFLIGEKLLHISGVIAVVMAAIFFIKTWRQHESNSEGFKTLNDFWEYIADLTNGILFFALGVATGLHDFQKVPFIAVLTAIAAMLIARAILIYGGTGLLNLAKRGFPVSWQHIMCLAFAMIAFSLILQPAVMQRYLKCAPL